MSIILFTDNIDEYLKEDDVIDFGNEAIIQLADSLYKNAESEIEYIKAAYEFVRDKVSHSADINEDIITCSASEVLNAKHGICKGAEPMNVRNHSSSALFVCYVRNYFSEAVPIKALAVALTTSRERSSQV